MVIDDVLGAYLKLRAMKDNMARRHKEELAPINDQMNKSLMINNLII